MTWLLLLMVVVVVECWLWCCCHSDGNDDDHDGVDSGDSEQSRLIYTCIDDDESRNSRL